MTIESENMSELRRFSVQQPVDAAHEIYRLRADNERLREALELAREEIRQSKFRYESVGSPHMTPGRINVWIHARDGALAAVDRALAASPGEQG